MAAGFREGFRRGGRVSHPHMEAGEGVFAYGAGHAITAERLQAFTDVVSDFLDRPDAFVVSPMSTVIHP